MDNERKTVTVRELIEDLQRIDMLDAPVEIAVMQYNKRFPVAYCKPFTMSSIGGRYIATTDGCSVRIPVFLPNDKETFMYTAKKKK